MHIPSHEDFKAEVSHRLLLANNNNKNRSIPKKKSLVDTAAAVFANVWCPFGGECGKWDEYCGVGGSDKVIFTCFYRSVILFHAHQSYRRSS